MLIGYGNGTAEIEDINCPAGFQVQADQTGKIWCSGPGGQQMEPSFAPSTKASVVTPMGILGWGALIAGGLVVASMLMGRKAKPNRRRGRRRARRNVSVSTGSAELKMLSRCETKIRQLQDEIHRLRRS